MLLVEPPPAAAVLLLSEEAKISTLLTCQLPTVQKSLQPVHDLFLFRLESQSSATSHLKMESPPQTIDRLFSLPKEGGKE